MRTIPDDIVEFAKKLSNTGFSTREKARYLLVACVSEHGKLLSVGNLIFLLSDARSSPSATTVASELAAFNILLAKKLKKTKFIYSIEKNALRLFKNQETD
mgnify:CR=1 FL=1